MKSRVNSITMVFRKIRKIMLTMDYCSERDVEHLWDAFQSTSFNTRCITVFKISKSFVSDGCFYFEYQAKGKPLTAYVAVYDRTNHVIKYQEDYI